MRWFHATWVFAVLVLAFAVGPAAADILVLQGTAAMDDAWVWSGGGGGTYNDLQLQRGSWIKHVFIKFDLSGLPAGQTINSAKFHVDFCNDPPDHTGIVIDVHYLTRDWDEATVSWTNASNVGGNPVPWTTPGGDYEVEPAMQLNDIGDPAIWDEMILADFGPMVQAWLNGRKPNYGLIYKYRVESPDPNNINFNIAASEWAAHVQPYLTIDYIPEPATVALLGLGGVGLVALRRRR